MKKQEILKLSVEEALHALGSSVDGLKTAEAEKRLQEHGPNTFKKVHNTALKILGRQFKSSLIYLLIVASAISYWLGHATDGTIIVVILLINTLLGFYQEYKSEKVIEKLSKFMGKQAIVKRDGKLVLIDEAHIVPGDVITIREGDMAPADMKLLSAEGLQMNESQLTGESASVAKCAIETKHASHAAASREAECTDASKTLIFTGSVVEKGTGVGVVYATGNETELGTIATLSTHTKKKTQYEKSLQSFSSFLMRVVLGGLALIFILKLIINPHTTDFPELLLFIVALATAVVPEALPVIATVTMSNGALKLSKKHVVVKRLSALEDLGNVNVLCTDKTGTITENRIEITRVTSDDEPLMLTLAYASIEFIKGHTKTMANSYDQAFFNYTSKDIKQAAAAFKVLKELPFDPDARRKRVVIENTKARTFYLVELGSPETLLDIARTPKKAAYERECVREGAQGLRHFGVAYKEIAYTEDFDIPAHEKDLLFLGYVTLSDPLRPTAPHAIELAQKLGITIKILTGDSREVAEYAGREIHLLAPHARVYTGDDLEKLSADNFKSVVEGNHVFARVSPSQKYKIIEVLKENNVVAYQGDGINDAPSLKLADVAIAVDHATDIAKENADIILLNKNLEVVINGIKYGRSIFVNINKYIKYTMVGNFGNFLALGALYLISSDLPLLPVQVLLTSLITDVPLLAISADTVGVKEVVRPEKHNTRELIFLSLLLGVPTALFEISYFAILRGASQPIVQTGLFLFLTLVQVVVFFSVRSNNHFWRAKLPSPVLTAAMFVACAAALCAVYAEPFQKWFEFVSLPAQDFMLMAALVCAYFVILDAVKTWYYKLGVKQ